MKTAPNWNKEFVQRFEARYDELKWLYCETYNNDMQAFSYLCNSLYEYYHSRSAALKKRDREREKTPFWYSTNSLVGMMLYVDNFADNLQGVRNKIAYLGESGVNYLHLMPLLKSPKDRSDGGYAVADFRRVQPELGTMKDLEALTAACHKNGISVCLDFVMNHTSEDHAWAKAARAGDEEARKRYFFFDNWDIPFQFERTVPQVFPTTAPGNFTYLPDCDKVVMTTFYPYQWDLNYGNCVVFNDMVGNMLSLANRGIDVIRLDAVPYIWKALGTTCRTLVRMMRIICEIVCPSVLLLGEVVMEPSKVAPYFGTPEKPECHMLYNVTTMASTWHTVATKDVRLLNRQMRQLSDLPKDYVFLNYLRCHDDIGWGLDYDYLLNFGMSEVPHKRFLNDYFTGKFEGSPSRGELYNDDESLGDARLCGTTASLCGIEEALEKGDTHLLDTAVKCGLELPVGDVVDSLRLAACHRLDIVLNTLSVELAAQLESGYRASASPCCLTLEYGSQIIGKLALPAVGIPPVGVVARFLQAARYRARLALEELSKGFRYLLRVVILRRCFQADALSGFR